MTARMGFRALLCGLALLTQQFAGAAIASAQQTGTVQGVVIDAASNSPIVGAQVVIQGTRIGMITNQQGRFVLQNVPPGQLTLRVELIGYKTVSRSITIAAGQATVANVSLEQTAVALRELVVTGVSGGAQERAKVPFTVSRIDASSMPVQAVNAMSQLQGRVPGANIAQISGRPGTAPAVILRGPTSINGSGRGQGPLYIVDGVLLGSSIADLNPADIESVEIVKGAAASTLYGSRAAGGVISITTKRGAAGAAGALDGVHFTARTELGLNDIEGDFGIARYMPFLLDETGTRFCVLDSYGTNNLCSRTVDYLSEQKRVNDQALDYALNAPAFPVDPGSTLVGPQTRRVFLTGRWPGTTYNAVQQLVDPKPLSLSDFSMAGRMGGTTFFTSVGNTRQGGAIMGLDGYERINGRINVGHRFSDDLSVDINSYISRSTQDGSNQEEGGTGFFRLTRTPAIVDITQRDSQGRLFIRTNLASGGVQNENPLYSFENIDLTDTRWRYLVGGTVRYTPLEWFDADGNFSLDRLSTTYSYFRNRGYRTTNSVPATNQGGLSNSATNAQSINASLGATVRPKLVDWANTRFNLRANYEGSDDDYRNLNGSYLRVADVTSAANLMDPLNIGVNATTGRTRQLSYSVGAFFDMLDRYTIDVAVRRDGSSRFGADHRWQTYGRGSGAWLMAREKWFPASTFTTFTLRGSYGTAGNVPSYSAQYETYSIGAGGALSASTLGNPELSPEVVTEYELGGEWELWGRWGATLTYANSIARDQILPVPLSVSTGFPTQWQNAGAMRNQTWEGTLTLPVLRNWNGVTWTVRTNYTQNRAVVEELNVAPFFIGTTLQGTTTIIRIAEGERYGNLYGRKFMTRCSELPRGYAEQCGTGTSAFQKNDEGYIVWVGAGNNPGMGYTHNLWNAVLPATQAPYNVQASWGMPILIRDTVLTATPTAATSPQILPLGHALPDFRLGFSQNLQYKRFSVYALLEGVFGQSVWNQGRHWSYLDFLSHDVDQGGKSVEAAKPIGYYYRAGPGPGGNNNGIGGFYDILGPNTRFVEDASFLKLRELSASYNVGRVAGFGDWTVSLTGRNLKTWTDYTGFDPEVGVGGSGGESGSGLINAVDAFTFPQLRTVSLVLSTTF